MRERRAKPAALGATPCKHLPMTKRIYQGGRTHHDCGLNGQRGAAVPLAGCGRGTSSCTPECTEKTDEGQRCPAAASDFQWAGEGQRCPAVACDSQRTAKASEGQLCRAAARRRRQIVACAPGASHAHQPAGRRGGKALAGPIGSWGQWNSGAPRRASAMPFA